MEMRFPLDMLEPLRTMMSDTSSAQWVAREPNMERATGRSRMLGRSTRNTNSWMCESARIRCDSSITDHNSLGTGTFAEVRKAVCIETGDLRAIKVSPSISRLKKSADKNSKLSNTDSQITPKRLTSSGAKSKSVSRCNTRIYVA
jgi:hypothetical protein